MLAISSQIYLLNSIDHLLHSVGVSEDGDVYHHPQWTPKEKEELCCPKIF